jgi:hypothetical protein
MNAEKKVVEGVEKAQKILTEYIEPGERDCKEIVGKLLDVLDDRKFVEAVDEVKHEADKSKNPKAA